MKPIRIFQITIAALLTTITVVKAQPNAQTPKTQIMLLGCAHLGQEAFYKQGPSMDMFSPGRQKEIAEINRQLAAYRPDLILVEREPQEQATVDSAYQAFKTGHLKFTDLSHGRAEQYQFGCNLAKQLNHSRIYGIDFYQSISTRLFKSGQNLEQFTENINNFAGLGRSLDQQLKDEKLSLKQYLLTLNSPEINRLTYYTLFIKPAVVTEGTFGKLDATVDSASINKHYIGAEYISIFYGRELKIFSNVLNAQLAHQAKRILVIMGQRHTAVLSKLFAEEPAYEVVPVSNYLK
ncbi:hypothetical protein GCM10027037_24300 [Mucilaginibacter koreensis]